MLTDVLIRATPHAQETGLSPSSAFLIGVIVSTIGIWYLYHERASMDCPDCGSRHLKNMSRCESCGEELEKNIQDRPIDKLTKFNKGSSR